MEDPGTRIKRYRDRAEEIRAIASAMKHGESQQTLLRLADDYLHMADAVDTISGSNPPTQQL